MNQIQLSQNVGQYILFSIEDGLVQFKLKLVREKTLVLLRQAGVQPQIKLAPAYRLSKEVGHARLVFNSLFGGEFAEGFGKSIGQPDVLLYVRQLPLVDLHGDLDACFPAALLHIEDAGDRVGSFGNRFRSEEQRDTIG